MQKTLVGCGVWGDVGGGGGGGVFFGVTGGGLSKQPKKPNSKNRGQCPRDTINIVNKMKINNKMDNNSL